MSTEPFTFNYPGREAKSIQKFLYLNPEIKDKYIYDLTLSSGSLLYSCRGGIGATKEPYILEMHKWIKTSTLRRTLISTYDQNFKTGGFTRWKYLMLKEKFNSREFKINSWGKCAELYLLWASTNYAHRYTDSQSYLGGFCPTPLNLAGLEAASSLSKSKNISFKPEDIFTFNEGAITSDMVVYVHFPSAYGNYGAGWLWSKSLLGTYVRLFKELDSLGVRVLVSSKLESRARVGHDPRHHFPDFNYEIIQTQNGNAKTIGSKDSEIYLSNF